MQFNIIESTSNPTKQKIKVKNKKGAALPTKTTAISYNLCS